MELFDARFGLSEVDRGGGVVVGGSGRTSEDHENLWRLSNQKIIGRCSHLTQKRIPHTLPKSEACHSLDATLSTTRTETISALCLICTDNDRHRVAFKTLSINKNQCNQATGCIYGEGIVRFQ